MKTICVHSFKGGTGKSLISVVLAYKYSLNEKVLIIDGDYDAPCLTSFFPTASQIIPFSSYLQGKASLDQVIYPTNYPNLFCSYAPPPNFNDEIRRADPTAFRKYLQKLTEALGELQTKHKFTKLIIDSSNGLNLAAVNHLAVSDQSIVVLRPSRYGVHATRDITKSVYKKLENLKPQSKRKDFLVWNQIPSEDPKVNDYIKQWTQLFVEANINYGTAIPYLTSIVSSMITDEIIPINTIATYIEPYMNELFEKLEK